MDFSQHYYGGGQPYPFVGIPPLTPSHSHSAPSEEFNNQSPPEIYEHFQNFDNYGQFNSANGNSAGASQPQGFVSRDQPPTPPTQHPSLTQQTELLPFPKADPDQNSRNQAGSNSDDDDMTPAQSRRKAQNRAAQRAFRERKERHVKDLEAKVASLEAAQQQTNEENEKLKRDLQKMSTENEILRATSTMGPNGAMSPASNPPTTTGPMHFNPTDFYSDLLANHTNKTPSHRVVESESGERLLAAGATWDLIINHPLFKSGLVDLADVSERLKSQARCDGQGPVFEEAVILRAIEHSVASGSDELL
ncbi:bZIP transcription factor [Xylariales sp. PMI_506]|nr:bZIP transcription factor [Xylariales sp. PMI_506]